MLDNKEKKFNIVTEQARYPIKNIRSIFDEQKNLQPDYQRKKVWDDNKKSKLIESFIMNIPVPPIFLYETSYSNYEVVDGQQRISTLISFLNNEFELQNLEFYDYCDGKTYSTLSSDIRASIDRRYISATILLNETAKNSEDEIFMKRILFERLNTGGVELSKQEVRNALYGGLFNKLLFELSENAYFKKLWKFNAETKRRMEDCELILRFFAYYDEVKKVSKSKSIFSLLDSYMQEAVNFNEEKINYLRKLFTLSISKVYKVFGKDALKSSKNTRKRDKMMYDTLMLVVSQNLDRDLGDCSEIKFSIIEDYKNMFNGKYTSISEVKKRIDVMNKCLK